MKEFSVLEILAAWLEENGYNGLFCPLEPCGCLVGNLLPCGDAWDGCLAGYLQPDGSIGKEKIIESKDSTDQTLVKDAERIISKKDR